MRLNSLTNVVFGLLICAACAPAAGREPPTAAAAESGQPRAAAGAMARHGEPISRDTSWWPLFQRGLAHERAGRYAEGERDLLQALALMDRDRHALPADREAIHFTLGALYADTRKLELAERHFQRALGLGQLAFGADHPNVAETLEGLAIVLDYAGKYGDAERRLRELLARAEARRAAPADVGRLWCNLATNLKFQAKNQEAHEANEKGIVLLEKSGELDGLAHAMNLRGTLEYERGDLRAARGSLERAARLRQQVSGAEHPALATTLYNLCGIDLDEQRLDTAEQHCGRALAIRRARLPADHPFLRTAVERYDEVQRLRAASSK